jgi:DNA-binding Lrp family transcriptional regulator
LILFQKFLSKTGTFQRKKRHYVVKQIVYRLTTHSFTEIRVKDLTAEDKKIIRDLLLDGRKSFQDIGSEIGVTKNTISKRFNKLKRKGIIIGATSHVNPASIFIECLVEFIITEVENAHLAIELLKRIQELVVLEHDPVENTIYSYCELKRINDFGRIKEIIRQKLLRAKIQAYLWEGRIINQPENLSVIEYCQNTVYDSANRSLQSIENYTLDEVDLQIIEELIKDGLAPFSTIAKSVGVTADTVARRYKLLKSQKAIKSVIQINPTKIGYQGTLDSRLSLRTNNNDRLATVKALSKIPDVFCIVETSGIYDFHVWSLVKDINHLHSLQNSISRIPGFAKMDSKVNTFFMDAYPGRRQYLTNISENM